MIGILLTVSVFFLCLMIGMSPSDDRSVVEKEQEKALNNLSDNPEPDSVPLSEKQAFMLAVEEDLPSQYILKNDGNIYLIRARQDLLICSAVRGVKMEIGSGEVEPKMTVAFLNKDGHVVEVSFSAGDIGGSSPLGVRCLRNAGLRISARDGLVGDLLRALPYDVFEPLRVKAGWISSGELAFGVRNQQIVKVDTSDIGPLVAGQYVPDDAMLEKWKQTVGANLSGNPYPVFLLCTALSGPMLALIEWRGGIFNFAFPTSSAKTTGLIIANHVWSGDAPLSWNNTRAFLDDACLSADGTFLALDEVPEDNLQTVESVTFSVCNGTRRGARPMPGHKVEDQGWNTSAAATSEFPVWVLAQFDAAKGKYSSGARGKQMRIKEGTFVRLIDVGGREETMWSDLHGERSKGLFLRTLEASSADLAGTVGPAFVYRLVNNQKLLGQDLKAWHARMMYCLAKDLGIDPDEDDGAFMRVMGHFCAVWLAGDRASAMEILPYSRKEVAQAVRTAAHSWAKIRKVGKYAVVEDPVAIVRNFALPRLGKELREVGSDRKLIGRTVYASAGWFNEESYFFRPSAIRALVQPKARIETDMKRLVQEFCLALEEAGALVRGGAKDCMLVRMPASIENGSRVYMLRREVIDDNGEEG